MLPQNQTNDELTTENVTSRSTESQRVTSVDFIPRKMALLIPMGTLLMVLLAFGGVHKSTLSIGQSILFIGAAFVIFKQRDSLARTFTLKHTPISVFVLSLFGWLIIEPTIATLVRGIPADLPEIRNLQVSWISSTMQDQLLYIAFIGVGFYLFRCSIIGRAKSAHYWMSLIATLAAGIGIAHWLSDNGLLFRYFEPDYKFVSQRARWPFVNPDHLGHFLIPAFFLWIALARIQIHKMFSFVQQYKPVKKRGSIALLNSSTFQRILLSLALHAVALLVVAVAISGTLSRAAWLATSIGILLLIAFSKFAAQPFQLASQRHRASPRPRQPSKLASLARHLSTPLIVVCALSIFLLFLNKRGQELIAERIEFSLIHTKDDVRWQMYQDTLPIIKSYPLLGVGLGLWEPYFRKHMSPLVAGINPVYLHSDPLQFLSETGLVGTIPVALLAFLITISTMRRIRKLDPSRGIRLAALLVGLWSALIASCLDFPLRIPAIGLQFGLLLALLCSEAEDEPIVQAKVVRHSNRAKFALREAIDSN